MESIGQHLHELVSGAPLLRMQRDSQMNNSLSLIIDSRGREGRYASVNIRECISRQLLNMVTIGSTVYHSFVLIHVDNRVYLFPNK